MTLRTTHRVRVKKKVKLNIRIIQLWKICNLKLYLFLVYIPGEWFCALNLRVEFTIEFILCHHHHRHQICIWFYMVFIEVGPNLNLTHFLTLRYWLSQVIIISSQCRRKVYFIIGHRSVICTFSLYLFVL